MTLTLRLSIVAIGALLLAPASAQSGEAKANAKADLPVATDAMKKGLMAALGKDFEFLGGELGWSTGVGNGRLNSARFWFARVRTKTAGEFGLLYHVKLDFPNNKNFPPPATREEYLLPIKIGQRDSPRLIRPGKWLGSAYPHANVGDTLVIPIRVGRYRSGHRFTRPAKQHGALRAFFEVAKDFDISRFLKRRKSLPNAMIRNDVGDRLKLLSSWGPASLDVSGKVSRRSLIAYFEFKKSGKFNVVGHLADADKQTVGPSIPFRVVPKYQPVTVVVEYFDLTSFESKGRSNSTVNISHGTIEVRVGDQLAVPCGEYNFDGTVDKNPRQGVVRVLPFKDAKAYSTKPLK